MANIIPFESAKLPASMAGLFKVERLGTAHVGGGGFPTVSIKGKVFHKVVSGERELITKPGEDEPASSIEVVIVAQNPHRSKVFYATGYSEGTDAKPTCYSNNGVGPEADAEEPQSKKCATCAHNQWGSRVSENGAKGKACSDSQRLAIAPVGMINDPMMIRVPAASLKALDAFGDTLAKRGVPYQLVATKIGFDYSVAHPSLTFKPVGMLDEDTAQQVFAASQMDIIKQIIGVKPVEDADDVFAPEPVKAIPKKVEVEEDEPVVAKPKKVVVEEPEEEAPVVKAAAPKPKTKVVDTSTSSGALEDDIADVMAGLDFDD
jgi:hypothetical protein